LVTKQSQFLLDFHCILTKNTMEVNGNLNGFVINVLMFRIRKKVIPTHSIGTLSKTVILRDIKAISNKLKHICETII